MKAIEMHSMRPRTPRRVEKQVNRELRKRIDPQLYVPIIRLYAFGLRTLKVERSGLKVRVNYPGANPIIYES